MRYIWQHAADIISSYTGSLPLAHFLKQYFKRHGKLGSRDRKLLSEITYSWYRCSKGFPAEIDFEEKVRLCLDLCGGEIAGRRFPVDDKENKSHCDIDRLFPYNLALSGGITHDQWLSSMLVQPALFIRVRKLEAQIEAILNRENIPFYYISTNCMSLPNGAAIDKLLPQDAYVVQDASSQQTAGYFHPCAGEHWYDCCSGAGGKSLLLKDKEPSVILAVSDIRDTILHNLRERFRMYGHKAPITFTTNVSDAKQLASTLRGQKFDHIICDAPCSGSGTWSRTPEQMYFFDPAALETFSSLQASIAGNVSTYLKKGGTLIYITCSVFKAENEDVVEKIGADRGLKLQEMQLINGTGINADSMFIAVFRKL